MTVGWGWEEWQQLTSMLVTVGWAVVVWQPLIVWLEIRDWDEVE